MRVCVYTFFSPFLPHLSLSDHLKVAQSFSVLHLASRWRWSLSGDTAAGDRGIAGGLLWRTKAVLLGCEMLLG